MGEDTSDTREFDGKVWTFEIVDNGCWGVWRCAEETEPLHRCMFAKVHGRIPKGVRVRNKTSIPDGGRTVNFADLYAEARDPWGCPECSCAHCVELFGEQNSSHVLRLYQRARDYVVVSAARVDGSDPV